MRTSTFVLNISMVAAAAILAGCDNSKSTSTSGQASEPALPKTQEAVAAAAEQTRQTVAAAASTVAENAKATASEVTSRFLQVAKAQGDSVLKSLGEDLGAKAKSLMESCGVNSAVTTNLNSALTALTKNQDNQALAPAFQLGQGLSLTPQQTQLAKDIGNLASAFVVQRNFSALPNAQGEVATLVSALREGQYAAAVPPLQKIWNNASLTPAQKELLGSVADKYAPSLKQAAGALQQGLQQLQGLPGVRK